MIKKNISKFFHRQIVSLPEKGLVLYVDKSEHGNKRDEIINRAHFFLGNNFQIESVKSVFWKIFFDKRLKLLGHNALVHKSLRQHFHILDYDVNPMDGWEWHYVLTKLNQEDVDLAVKKGKEKFDTLLNLKVFDKAYIFGTGNSLEKAYQYNFSDGLRIVCNTIVKDKDIWHYIKPHIIVAADAIYHFGHTAFPRAFRNDLLQRLKESPNTYFIYPAHFHVFVSKVFQEVSNQIIPIPFGNYTEIKKVSNNFTLPRVGNILNNSLLPIALSFAKNIFLLGFDGRSPNDKLFWKNSNKHFYQEYVEELKENHPSFFETLVPKENPMAYVKNVHGDFLENTLQRFEADGYYFESLQPSWTETINKRHKGY